MERGTLYQLRNLINRRNVVKKVKSDVNANEAFFELVVTGHIITCAMEILGMSSIDEVPSSGVIQSPEEVWLKDDSERKAILEEVSSLVVEQYVDLSTIFSNPRSKHLPATTDHINAYACETLSLGLLFMEFKDAIREGDGNRVMRVWKYFLLLFKASGRKNYAIEALTLLSQYYLILPPHLAEQVKWSRFINVHGLPGHNISCDLHMEHLNRVAKIAIEGLGANKSQKAIQRIGKAIGTVSLSLENFDTISNVPAESGAHTTRSSEKDLLKIIKQLAKTKVFSTIPERRHKSFANMKTNLIRSLSELDLKKWMTDHYATVLNQNPNT